MPLNLKSDLVTKLGAIQSILYHMVPFLIIFFLIIVVVSGPNAIEDPVVLSTVLLTSVTAAMVAGIYRQVVEQKKYLRNFEPSLKLFELNNQTISWKDIKNKDKIMYSFTGLNDSQTASLITSISIRELGESGISFAGFDEENAAKRYKFNEAKYMGTVPIKPNEAKIITIRINQDAFNASSDGKDKILSQEYLTVVFKGNFGEAEKKLDIEKDSSK